MKAEDKEPGRAKGRFAASALATVLVVSLPPTSAAEEVVLERRGAARVLDSAVTYYHQKTVERRVVESICFFDPKVENSLRCSWRWASGGADPFRLAQRVKKDAKKWCKEAGGKKCTLLWRNGSLRFDGLSPEHSEKLESVLANIPDYVVEATPLPDGVGVGDDIRDWFPEVRDFFDGRRNERRGRNPHYAICANESGTAAWYYVQGRGAEISNVRKLCVLKCTAMSHLYSEDGDCYVVYEDGKFASAAAEAALAE